MENERGAGREAWMFWCVSFGDWLVKNQNGDGSFYRMYFTDGEPAWRIKCDSHLPVKFLLLLSRLTGKKEYALCAKKAAEFAWNNYHRDGNYIGGTLDNPNCCDKEGGSLAMEAYLALYEFTDDKKWLTAAARAADYTETWIYIRDIPLPADDRDSREWSAESGTVGMQLVCAGHSLSDLYLAFNCGEYAKLARYTGDAHYEEVSQILLHNTKQALGAAADLKLKYPAFQQEHWTFSAGRGLSRTGGDFDHWLPWVTVSHLTGMRHTGSGFFQ